ncbi:MAG TPA: glycosyltransferase family 1 protein [Candidatus Saccharimonadales bacterium]|nr:glycosyltransferase family 1 protein [Candidatus Saccharimonadales bacterium]
MRSLKIAVDGAVLNDAAGKAVYLRSVLAAWRSFKDQQFVVYGYQPLAGESWPDNWRFQPFRSRFDRVRVFRHLPEDVLFSPSSYLTTLLSNRPTLTTLHDLVIYKVPVKLPWKTVVSERLLLKRAMKRSAAITVQTESIKKDLLELLPAVGGKVRVISPGIASLVSREQLPGPDRQKQLLNTLGLRSDFILFVGTIEPRKNISRLITAYQQLPPELQKGHQLVIAGKVGWPDAELARWLAKPPAGVRFVGRVDDATLATLYRQALFIAYPSLYEGVGYPVLEGFYWHKPVLTANVAATAEIGAGATWLADPYSVSALRRGLEVLLTNGAQRQALSAAGQAKLPAFSWDKAARAYLALLAEIA